MEKPIEAARRSWRRKVQNLCLQCGRTAETEDHHLAGRRNDSGLTVPLCRACHAQITELLRRDGVDMRYTADSIERVERSLKGTSVFLALLADALWAWAELLHKSETGT